MSVTRKLTIRQKEIEKYLFEIGFCPELAGFEILRECIYVASKDKDKYRKSVSQVLFEEVKERLGKSSTRAIETGIRYIRERCVNPKYHSKKIKQLIFLIITELGY